MTNIYDFRQNFRLFFIILSLILAGAFLYISNSLMKALEEEERNRMEIWAEATRQLANEDVDSDMSLVLKVIQSNTTIPVIILDDKGELLWMINMDSQIADTVSFVSQRVKELSNKKNLIEVVISDDVKQYLYYDDSVLLKRLQYYPYVQLAIMMLFMIIAFIAFSSIKRSEQNQVWVGLTKETAHQLGTPISSLMAWVAILKEGPMSEDIRIEMDKDISRLSTIADRFSKIGSKPKLENLDLNMVVTSAFNYMSKRVPIKTQLKLILAEDQLMAKINPTLFEWVIENLCKNSIDATDGEGVIEISLSKIDDKILLDIKDNGKGIPKNKFNTIFHPGYTTKRRGWGLGLTLVKRIIDEYHHGKIYVVESKPHKSTLIRIELNAV